MSDRGRSRRTARSTKATAPKATPDTEVEPGEEPAATAGAESDKTSAGAAATAGSPAEDTTEADETVSSADETASSDEPDAAASDDAASDDDTSSDDAASDDDDPDASASHEDDEDEEKVELSKGRSKSDRAKAPTPMTKAEKRAAARIAAAKAARRRRTGQAIAGTLIVLLVVGGAFAGVWYFGDRAEKNRVKCKPAAADAAAFPPLLGGMNKALATEPTITPSTDEVKTIRTTILIKGECKAVKAGQTVTVNYVGATMKDGKVFDASWPRKKTIEIPVGQKQLGKQPQVIEGWDEGLVGLKIGTRVQLDIPGSKAYGDDAPEGYPAGTLRFIVDILDAKDADSSAPAGLGG